MLQHIPYSIALFVLIWLAGYGLSFGQTLENLESIDQETFSEVQYDNKFTESDDVGEEITLDDFHYVPEDQYNGPENKFLRKISTSPGFSFLSSALVPGLGQASNKNWIRSAAYLAVEATAISLRITKQSSANRRQSQYNNFVNENWSVVKYARWLVDYNNFHEGANLTYDAVAENAGDLNRGADFNNQSDWNRVDLEALHQMERSTPICDAQGQCRTSNFSHVVPRFGTQQYYELASKYFQFGPGWNDFNQDKFTNIWSINQMSANWQQGAEMAKMFNDNFRFAGNMTTLLIVNHVVSAMDAFITTKLNIQRVHASASPENGGQFTLTYDF